MIGRLKKLIRPVLRPFRQKKFDSAEYWEQRYQQGGNSGSGSYGQLADFKAEFLNKFVEENGVLSVMEFGCGDGNQLSLAKYPKYTGLDVSTHAVSHCARRFADDATKGFFQIEPRAFYNRNGALKCDLALSLDVIFHLIEDDVFEAYMAALFSVSEKFVVVYSSDTDDNTIAGDVACHFRNRNFTPYVAKKFPEWTLVGKEENPYLMEHERMPTEEEKKNLTVSHFFIFKKD